MKKLTFLTLSLALAISCNNPSSNKTTSKKDQKVNDNLASIGMEMNKKCPMAVDEVTRMDSVSVYNGYLITFHYTILNADSKNMDLNKFKTLMETDMSGKYKTDPQLAIYRDNDIAIAYDYKDKNGQFVSYFVVDSKK